MLLRDPLWLAAVMNLPEAKRVIAYMPELLGTEKQKKRKPFTAVKDGPRAVVCRAANQF